MARGRLIGTVLGLLLIPIGSVVVGSERFVELDRLFHVEPSLQGERLGISQRICVKLRARVEGEAVSRHSRACTSRLLQLDDTSSER